MTTPQTEPATVSALQSNPLLGGARFWPLQNIGWLGFFLVHWLSGVANGKSSTFIGMSIVMSVTGWCVTLVLNRVYSRLWQRPLANLVPAVLPWFLTAVVIMTLANSRARFL